jgi:hypothetical protein
MVTSLLSSEEDFFVSSTFSTSSASSFVARSLQRIDPSMTGFATHRNGESIFEFCSRDALPLECISNEFEESQSHMAGDANEWLLLFAAALIFFMQAGFAMLCAGCVRVKNVGTCNNFIDVKMMENIMRRNKLRFSHL